MSIHQAQEIKKLREQIEEVKKRVQAIEDSPRRSRKQNKHDRSTLNA